MANYSAPLGVLSGLESLKSVIEATLKEVTTQHALSTTVVEILDGGREARSLAYFTASHFGMGGFEGQVRCAFLSFGEKFGEFIFAVSFWVLELLVPLASCLFALSSLKAWHWDDRSSRVYELL